MSVCLHWARQEEGTLQSLGEEPVGGPFPPAPCRCLTLGISSDNNRRRKWAFSSLSPQLTICYLDMLMTSEERRKQLRDQYCFECDCIRCQTQDKVCGVKSRLKTSLGGVWKVFPGPPLLVTLLQRALGSRTERELRSLFPGTFVSYQGET